MLDAALRAVREQPPELQVRVLACMAKPSDTAAVRALAEAEASAPGSLELLDPPLRSAVRGALVAALDTAGPEAARKLLSYFAARAERPSERAAVLALLEQQVRSRSRRVGLHAHRLLRSLAPRDQYLRATRPLLDDPDPTTVRLAIRVLAFGGDEGATEAIAERLCHQNNAVAAAAREGLLVLGDRAAAALEKARNGARPDWRAAIDALLDEIRARS